MMGRVKFVGHGQKIYSPRLSKDDWARLKHVITAQRANGTMKDLMAYMKRNYGFTAR
jgi:hypothetical protein